MKILTKTIFCAALFVSLFSCDNMSTKSDESGENSNEQVSNETAEPTLLGKWRLVNFEMDGNQRFDECDATTVWDFTEQQTGNYQGKKLFRLKAEPTDLACRLHGFEADWEEIDEGATEVYIDNVKVGKGTNKGGVFKIQKLTTKELELAGGTWVYFLER